MRDLNWQVEFLLRGRSDPVWVLLTEEDAAKLVDSFKAAVKRNDTFFEVDVAGDSLGLRAADVVGWKSLRERPGRGDNG